MKKMCAWCKKEFRAPGNIPSKRNVTQHICTICAMDMTKQEPRTAGQILNLINEPLFMIDIDGVVRGANKAASEMLNKKLPDIEGQLGGDAFECSYARHEGGCGKTVHCRTCAIRNIVMDTLNSGHGFDKVPAFQSIRTPTGPATLRFVITTEKAGDHMLLRIDSCRKAFSP